MTPEHMLAVRAAHGLTQTAWAALVSEQDPHLRVHRVAVSRWEAGHVAPNGHAMDALVRTALHLGIPATVTLRDDATQAVILTTNHASSSYGQPVAAGDGIAYGPGDVTTIALGIPVAEVVDQLRALGWAT